MLQRKSIAQGKLVDIALAYTEINEIKSQMLNIRQDIDEQFHVVYLQAVRMPSKVSVTPWMPRIVSLQNHRNNTPASSPEIFFVGQLQYRLLDNYIWELNSVIIALIRRTPELLLTFKEIKDLGKVLVESYKMHLPNPEVFDLEIFLWKNKWILKQKTYHPLFQAHYIHAQRHFSQCAYPPTNQLLNANIFMWVWKKLFYFTQAVHMVWASMKEERLASLATMNIHRECSVNYVVAVKNPSIAPKKN